jgi:predicted RNA-binding Zn-ribbon protein involved in translation (DUF1610 family)
MIVNKPITIKFHCPQCGIVFEKTQRELNLYGMGLNCPKCGKFIDGEQNND